MRPELAVLLAYAKIWLCQKLMDYRLCRTIAAMQERYRCLFPGKALQKNLCGGYWPASVEARNRRDGS